MATKISKIIANAEEEPPVKLQVFKKLNTRKKITKWKSPPPNENKVEKSEKSISDSEKEEESKIKARGKRVFNKKQASKTNEKKSR